MKYINLDIVSIENYFKPKGSAHNVKEHSIRSAGVVVFSRVTLYFINMLGIIVLARFIPPEDFGLVAMITAPFMILLDFGNLGLSEATVNNEEINHGQISTLFWINTIASLTLSTVFITASPLICLFYKESKLQSIIFAIALVFLLGGLSTQHLALLRRGMQFYRISAIEISASIISVVTAISFACTGWGYWAIVARQVAFSAVTTIGAWILCPWRPGLPKKNAQISSLLRFGINFLGGNTIYYFSKNIDKVLLGWLYGSKPLGYYDRAYHLFAMPLNQLVFPLGNVAFSALSRLRNDAEQFRVYYLKSISILSFIGMLLSTLLTLIGKDLVLLLLGRQWDIAGQIFSIMSLSIGVSLVYMTFGWINLSLGRADRNFRWILFSVVLNILLYIIGLSFGPIGLAIAFTASPYILIVPGLLYAGKPIGLTLSSILSTIWKYFLSALMAGILTWLVLTANKTLADIFNNFNVIVRIFITSILCTGLYVIIIIILYQSTAPIRQFMNILGDAVPIFSKNK